MNKEQANAIFNDSNFRDALIRFLKNNLNVSVDIDDSITIKLCKQTILEI